MFSGLIEEVGNVGKLRRGVLSVYSAGPAPKQGDSIAINGVCLTVTRQSVKGKTRELFFDLSEETLRKTTLGRLKPGDRVNVERALTLAKGLGGHLVQGHVDGTGRVEAIRPQGEAKTIWFRAPREIMQYVVPKGSVTIDGVSLTAAEVTANGFSVALIPFTLSHTTLGEMRTGAEVNLEADVIGKYVAKYMGKK